MNILFVCNGNVARSQEAELFFNKLSKKNHAVSAGVNVEVGKPIDPLVVSVMEEIGFLMQSSVRKTANKHMVDNADLIISFMSYDELPEILQAHPNMRYWNVLDPRHQPIMFHRGVRDQIKKQVEELVREIQ